MHAKFKLPFPSPNILFRYLSNKLMKYHKTFKYIALIYGFILIRLVAFFSVISNIMNDLFVNHQD